MDFFKFLFALPFFYFSIESGVYGTAGYIYTIRRVPGPKFVEIYLKFAEIIHKLDYIRTYCNGRRVKTRGSRKQHDEIRISRARRYLDDQRDARTESKADGKEEEAPRIDRGTPRPCVDRRDMQQVCSAFFPGRRP